MRYSYTLGTSSPAIGKAAALKQIARLPDCGQYDQVVQDGKGTAGKVPVFGLLKRGGRVYAA